MKVAELARLLGVTPDAVYKLRRKGMPTHSHAAAAAWRDANLDPFRRQGGRVDRPGPSPAAVVSELGIQVWESIEQGAHLEPALATARAAMGRLSHEQQALVRWPVPLWDALTAQVAGALEHDPTPLTDAEAASMGKFWSAATAGEVQVNPPADSK